MGIGNRTSGEWDSVSQFSRSAAQLFVTPWNAACQASLSITNSQSLLKLTSIESVMPSNHLILCRPLLLQSFPPSGSFPMSQFFTSGSQSIGVSTSASVLSMNIQGWFPLGLTGLISLQSKGLSRVFSREVNVLCLVTQSCQTLCDHMNCSSPGSSVCGDSLGKNTGVGCHALLQGVFPN